ncbi:MAG: hypothetical protein JWP12_743 [Bacteroidetes bacterium]|nr:hypothetical protein [Bacteroidota bacterium]
MHILCTFDSYSVFVRMYDTKEVKEKERIMDAAMVCFQRFGTDKTTLGDIAENLGYSRTKIYYYFKDKESVCKAVLTKMSKLYFEEQENIVLAPADPAVCLEKLLQNRIRYVLEIQTQGIFSLSFTQEVMENDEDLKLILEKEQQLYVKIIKKGIRENVFSIKNVALHTQILLDSVSGYLHVITSRYSDMQSLSPQHLKEIKDLSNAQIKFIIQSLY